MPQDSIPSDSAIRHALQQADCFDSTKSISTSRIYSGINETFEVTTDRTDERCIVKFGTFSTVDNFRAGAVAYRLLDEFGDLPVPTVHSVGTGPAERPPFVVLERLPGTELREECRESADGHPKNLPAVRLLGAVIDQFGEIPADAVAGYGSLAGEETTGTACRAVADHDDWPSWLIDYTERLCADPPDHDALAAVAAELPQFLRANRDRLPSNPDPSVVVTDFSPGNLLYPGHEPPASLDGVTGVIDLERAKIGSAVFTAINAEYLLTRGLDDPEPVRDALYARLSFGPDHPLRDVYRAVALGRSVHALDLWYDPGSERHRNRGDTVAQELAQLTA